MADPPVEHVYREAFAAHGLVTSNDDVIKAVHATWRDVDACRDRGEERWGGPGGEHGFWRRFVETVFQRLGGGDLPDALLAHLVEHFRTDDHWRLFPEVPQVLTALRGAGKRLVVVSNWDSTLPALLTRMELSAYFDAVVVSASFGTSKPARAIFDEAVRLAGVPREKALHVGDSPEEDYLGAKAAGLEALLLDRAGRARTGFETIASLDEVLPRVL